MGIQPFDNQALLSMRSGGYSFTDALCELIDNSIWHGNAKMTRIGMSWNVIKSVKRLSEVFVSDNGSGMDSDTLAKSVQIGKSTSFGSTENFGRFGYGLIAGALTQCAVVEIYSNSNGKDWFYIKYEFNKVANGSAIPDPIKKNPPEKYLEDIDKTGTVVIWSSFDIAEEFDDDWEPYTISGSKKGDLGTLFVDLGRVYRKKIGHEIVGSKNGKTVRMKNTDVRIITLNNRQVTPVDPLYFSRIPGFEDDPDPDEVLDEITIDVPVHIIDKERTSKETDKVTIRMTLLNKKWRGHNSKKVNPETYEIQRRHIHRNEGISVLRNGREVSYDMINGIGPAVQTRDRYRGVEIEFPATLDQRFTVKNVKVGVKPDKQLIAQLREVCYNPLNRLGKEISGYLKETEKGAELEETSSGIHHPAEDRFVNQNVGVDVETQEPLDPEQKEKEVESLINRFKNYQDSIDKTKLTEIGVKFYDDPAMNENSPFFEVKNNLGNNIVIYNLKHPFFIHLDEIYNKINELSDLKNIEELIGIKLNDDQLKVRDEFQHEIQKTRYLIDLLLGSFAAAKGSMEVMSDKSQTISSTVNTIISRWTENLFSVANDKKFNDRVNDEV